MTGLGTTAYDLAAEHVPSGLAGMDMTEFGFSDSVMGGSSHISSTTMSKSVDYVKAVVDGMKASRS